MDQTSVWHDNALSHKTYIHVEHSKKETYTCSFIYQFYYCQAYSPRASHDLITFLVHISHYFFLIEKCLPNSKINVLLALSRTNLVKFSILAYHRKISTQGLFLLPASLATKENAFNHSKTTVLCNNLVQQYFLFILNYILNDIGQKLMLWL